jgi:hypothetical protein
MSTETVVQKEELTLPISGQQAVVRTVDGVVYRSMASNKRVHEVSYDYLATVTDSIGGTEHVTSGMIKNLLVPDQEAIAVRQYILNYGDFDFRFTCPECREPDDHCVDLRTLDIIPISPESSGPPDPIITVILPATNKIAEVGMLTGHKEALLQKLQADSGTRDINQVDFQAVRSLDGDTKFTYEDILKLPVKDHKAIRMARRKLIAGYDTNITVPCRFCNERTRMNILMHRDFWVPGGWV